MLLVITMGLGTNPGAAMGGHACSKPCSRSGLCIREPAAAAEKLRLGVKGKEHEGYPAVVSCNSCRTSVVTRFHPGEGSCCLPGNNRAAALDGSNPIATLDNWSW